MQWKAHYWKETDAGRINLSSKNKSNDVCTCYESAGNSKAGRGTAETCQEFEGVTFRLDDVNEASKHATGSPYPGYNNSFNQVGEHFGDVGQCSISLDVSVIQRMQSDPKYEQAVKGTIENS